MYQNLNPDKTLLLTVNHEYAQDTNAFPDALVLPFDGALNEQVVKGWLHDLDVVVSCETFYDWRVVKWARELSVKTILYVMPELLKHELGNELPMPDRFWYPSSWRMNECPAGTLLPVPCDARPFVPLPDDDVKFIHVAGKKALGDRNGTDIMFEALRRTRKPIDFTTYMQTGEHVTNRLPAWHRASQGVEDKWSMYESAHVIVLPRRFGGLSLPVVEALSCGLAVVMTDTSPNNDWPIVPINANPGRKYAMPCGRVPTWDALPDDIVRILRVLSDPAAATAQMLRSRLYAANNTWEIRRDDFLRALDD